MNDKNNIVVAGHRGYCDRYPENTLLSFRKALDLGVDMIEFDVRLTSDKKLVVIHDEKVDRTTDGRGLVRDFTLKEIKELDAGSWFSNELVGLKIPTLEELMDLVSAHKKLLFNVEIKEKTHETVDLTIDVLKKYDVLDRCVMTCFDAGILKYIWQKYQLKCQGFPDFCMSNFEQGENGTYSFLYSVGINLKYLTKELVDFFTSRNIMPWPYCVNDEKWALKTIELGGTLVTCDDPEPALKIFKEKGYHK
jgi:glycerophosphoryl diester phosphodiesterase